MQPTSASNNAGLFISLLNCITVFCIKSLSLMDNVSLIQEKINKRSSLLTQLQELHSYINMPL